MAEPLRIAGRVSSLAAGLTVRRVLPSAVRRSVGPFIFFDHFGPVDLPAGADSDVGGHPHIGLATVSYLFEGSLMHRDSLGSVQKILPGDINWMTAGRGIVHSERVPDDARGQPRRLHGLQLWVALPPHLEDCAPTFQHVPCAALPQWHTPEGVQLRLLVGQVGSHRSPVQAASPTLYLEVQLPPHTAWTLPPLAEEMALYSPQHALQLDGQALAPQVMAVLPAGLPTQVQAAAEGARLVVIGGAPLVRPVRMWWNFVASEPQRIAQAAQRWEDGGFEPIPGETGRVPGPSRPFVA